MAVWAAGLAAAALWAVLPSAPAEAQPKELPARVVTVAGEAQTFKKGAAAWEPAKLRAELAEGDGARTLAGSRLALTTASGQALRLAELSQVFFVAGDAAGADGPTRVRLDAGWLWVAVRPGSPAQARIQVRAGPVTVTVRGSGAGLRMNGDGSVLVRVYHGAAVCTGPGAEKPWERSLGPEQQLLVPAAGVPGEPGKLTRDKPEAVWVRWNEEQDHAGAYGGKPPRR